MMTSPQRPAKAASRWRAPRPGLSPPEDDPRGDRGRQDAAAAARADASRRSRQTSRWARTSAKRDVKNESAAADDPRRQVGFLGFDSVASARGVEEALRCNPCLGSRRIVGPLASFPDVVSDRTGGTSPEQHYMRAARPDNGEPSAACEHGLRMLIRPCHLVALLTLEREAQDTDDDVDEVVWPRRALVGVERESHCRFLAV